MSVILLAFSRPIIEEIFTKDSLLRLKSMADVVECEQVTTTEKLHALLQNIKPEILVTGWGSPRLCDDILENDTQLKYVCHCGGIIRKTIPKKLIKNGLLVTNWGSFAAKYVAEAALMGILSCLRKTTLAHNVMHNRNEWIYLSDSRTESLFGQRVGIFGFGASGQVLCKLLTPFQCEVSAYSTYESDEIFSQLNVNRLHSLEELFSANKIISIHAASIKQNHNIINETILARLQDGGILVNTARGDIIDESALIKELKSKRIYASLDVYETEPLPADSPLRGLYNVQLIPHQAGPTADKRCEIGNVAVANIERYIGGKPLQYVIDEKNYDFIS